MRMKTYVRWSFEIDPNRGIPENFSVMIDTRHMNHSERIVDPQEIVKYMNTETREYMKKLVEFINRNDLRHKEGTDEKGNSDEGNKNGNGSTNGPTGRVGR